MTDFNTDKNTQFAEDKAKNKLDELAGSAQQQFGDFVDSPKHQVKGAAKKYAAQANDAVSDVTAVSYTHLRFMYALKPS